MEIIIREDKHLLPLKWFNQLSRYDSITDVKFVDENTIVCANRELGKFYLVRFTLDPNTVQILHSIDAVFDGVLKCVDLMTMKGNFIYFVPLDNTIGILKLENNILVKQRLITITDTTLNSHSITFHPTKENIVYLGSALFNPKLVVFDIEKEKTLQTIVLEGMKDVLIKQVKFLDENRIVVSGTGGLISQTDKHQDYNSKIGVYDANSFTLLDSIELNSSHTDDVFVDENNVIYLVCQSTQKENILKFKFENNKLIKIGGLELPQFPHGIDIKYGMLAATSLKNSSVSIIKL